MNHAQREWGLNAVAKITNSCQPAQSVQADMGPNVLLFVNFLHVQDPLYLMI